MRGEFAPNRGKSLIKTALSENWWQLPQVRCHTLLSKTLHHHHHWYRLLEERYSVRTVLLYVVFIVFICELSQFALRGMSFVVYFAQIDDVFRWAEIWEADNFRADWGGRAQSTLVSAFLCPWSLTCIMLCLYTKCLKVSPHWLHRTGTIQTTT